MTIHPYAFPGIRLEDLPTEMILAMKHKVDPDSIVITHYMIANAIESITGIKYDQLVSSNRRTSLVEARAIYCHFARHYSSLSLKEIGALLGNRDHTTVIHNLKKYHDYYDQTEKFRKLADAVDVLVNKRGILAAAE